MEHIYIPRAHLKRYVETVWHQVDNETTEELGIGQLHSSGLVFVTEWNGNLMMTHLRMVIFVAFPAL